MNIAKIFNGELCVVDKNIKTQEALLRTIAKQGAMSPILKDIGEEQLYKVFKAREEQGSTGFGKGVALPHARIEGLTDFLLFVVVVPRGVAWGASDNKKVKVFVVVIGPREKPKKYLKVLAVVSRANSSRDMYKALLKVDNKTECASVFLKHTKVSGNKVATDHGMAKMKLFVLILYNEELLNDILELYIQEGIEGANILDSWGMGHFVSSIPLFMDFLGIMDEEKNSTKTILTMIPEGKIASIIEGIEEITGDLDKNNVGMILTLDIGIYRGVMKMI